jgi:membrane fusion protein, multidrug efflux system
MKKVLFGLLLLGAGAAALYWTYFRDDATGETVAGNPAPAAAGGAPPGMPVEAEPVKVQRLIQEIVAVGTLASDESVVLSSEISGRIARIHFSEGRPVQRGQLLFELDDSVHRAEVEQAHANLTLSQRNHERAEELYERRLVSTRERDEAAARLELDRASLQLAEAHLARTRIRAPFAGVAGLRQVSPGDYVNPGQALVSVEALSSLKVDFRLAEISLSRVSVGQTLNLLVDAYPGESFPGTVYAIDPRLAVETRSVGVRARVPNPEGRLRPGLFARVRLVIAERDNAILVPEQAIMPQGEQLFVYVIEDGKSALRPVTIGLRQEGRAEIRTGLKPGDVVITAGGQKIGPGTPVMAINLKPPADAGAPQPGS